ncbi:hypothetical protein CEP54_015580 [Fusarium duplospermum]|uniref:2EXR domain-containing protein n=1 Tax=Fusarium duplospermum TaxID=1325734 RepID=A0A428NN03_9HYPO|nr:hypothetical protein CEP54_015580 [Fusarium duplospermum]
MSGTFHCFNQLPWELKNMIWNFALRPSRPGVQIFNLHNRETDGPVENEMDVAVHDSYPYSNYRIAVPNCDNNNPSTYLLDGGLWTACKESRLVMERRYKSPRGSCQMVKNMQDKQPDAPATGYFKDHDGGSRYFTVLPRQDLFLFQLNNPATIDWEWLNEEIPLGSSTCGYRGRRNIALEYKPEWGLQLGKNMAFLHTLAIVKTFVRMAIDSESYVFIWIVDYNLKRKRSVVRSTSSDSGREPRTFYARDHRLIDIAFYAHPLEEFKYSEEVMMEKNDCNSITFAETINSAVVDHWVRRESHKYYPCSIGLLGWDNL